MDYQSEEQLEKKLISNLVKNHKYEYVKINDEAGLESNFRKQLNRLNGKNLTFLSKNSPIFYKWEMNC